MKKLFKVLLSLILILTVTSAAYAASIRATISLVETNPAFGEIVNFKVDAQVVKDSDLYLLWVANKCYPYNGGLSVEYLPVRDGYAGPFTLGPAPVDGGPQGSWSSGGATCTAYVWVFPNTSKPIRGASITYEVSP